MKILGTSFVAACVLGLAAVAGTGCANKSEGDKTLDRAKTMEDAGNMIKRGEQMKQDGAATEARGREMKMQGNATEGERLISEGEMKSKQGQAAIDQGKKMKM